VVVFFEGKRLEGKVKSSPLLMRCPRRHDVALAEVGEGAEG